MKEFLVIFFDIAGDICGSFRTDAMSVDAIRWSVEFHDMLSFVKSDIVKVLFVDLERASYKMIEL